MTPRESWREALDEAEYWIGMAMAEDDFNRHFAGTALATGPSWGAGDRAHAERLLDEAMRLACGEARDA